MRDAHQLTPQLEGLPRGSSWCPTEGALALRIAQASAWVQFVKGLPNSTLATVERDLAPKLTLQRGAAQGWDVFPNGLGMTGGASIDEALALVGDYLVSRFPPARPTWSPVPRGTNSGAPTYGSSDVDKLLHALMAAQLTDWDSAERTYRGMNTQFEAISTPHALVFSRTGPTSKAVPLWDWQLGHLVHVADGRSIVPRRRAVFGVPAFINMAILGHANNVKYGVMRLPWCSHPNEAAVFSELEADMRAIGRQARLISDDISGFDQAVRRVHQEGVAKHVYSKYWPGATVDLWLGAQKMGVLSGPITAGGRGFLYTRPHGGVTTSGIITTSLDGTLINLGRAITAYAHATRTSITSAFHGLVARRWGLHVWGDDTVMTVDSSFDDQRYVDKNTDIGFTTTPVDGATFLMKHYDMSQRTVYPLATRVIQQTMWNEKGGRSAAIELLGLYARTAGFEANPLWHDAWGLLMEGPKPEGYQFSTRTQLREIIRDPGFATTLQRDIKANPSIPAEWLARAERGHTEDQGLLAWLDALVGAAAKDVGAVDLTEAITLRSAEAHQKAAQLAAYLSTPVDLRRPPPGWIGDMLTRPDIEAEEQDEDTKGTNS